MGETLQEVIKRESCRWEHLAHPIGGITVNFSMLFTLIGCMPMFTYLKPW